MIKLASKNECTGCGACYNICTSDAIKMQADETGFLYPNVDEEKCINCLKCSEACPMLNKPILKNKITQIQYVARIKNEFDLAKSTSGGIFYALASYIIGQGGIVVGAIIDDDFNTYHRVACTIDELNEFRGSKYVQSEIRDTYLKTKNHLEYDRYVLFSGTPCQIYGLRGFLKKDYEKLICVDILCRSVPSPLLFKKYIELQSEKLGKILKISFRDKSKGYDYPNMKIEYKDKKSKKDIYYASSQVDPWLRLFLSNEGDRFSCKKCIIEDNGYVSDFTIGDYNDMSTMPTKFKDNKGCSRVYINTKKADRLLKKIDKIELYQITDDTKEKIRQAAVSGNRFNKKTFYTDANNMTGVEFFDKYYPNKITSKFINTIKLISYHLGIYSKIKTMVRKIRKI